MEPIQKLYKRLTENHQKYKISVSKTDYSNVCIECGNIERELDALDLSCKLRELRRLMLVRLWELETKSKKKYLA